MRSSRRRLPPGDAGPRARRPKQRCKPGEKLCRSDRAPLLAAARRKVGKRGRCRAGQRTAGSRTACCTGTQASGRASRSKCRRPAAATSASSRSARAPPPTPGWLLAPQPPIRSAVALFRRALGKRRRRRRAGSPSRRRRREPEKRADGAGRRRRATPLQVPNAGEPPTVQAQVLTVTGEGVWIDGERSDANLDDAVLQARRSKAKTGSRHWPAGVASRAAGRHPAAITTCPNRCPPGRRGASPGRTPPRPKGSVNASSPACPKA